MIAFLVAKDADEFTKYKKGILRNDKELEIKNKKGVKICDVILRNLGLDDNRKLCILLVLLIDKDGIKGNLSGDASSDVTNFLSNLKRTLFILKNREDKLTKEITSFCEKAIRVENDVAKSVAAEAVLFIHWGGGAPLEYEKQFNVFLKQHLEDKSKAQFTQIRSYAFSSRRAELFDVTRSKIEAPKTYDELIKLENRFKNAQVDDAFSYCAAKCAWKISADIKKEIIARLDRFATIVLNSSFDAEKKEELLTAVAVAKRERFDDAKNTSDTTAAFMAKILNKEVFHD